MATTCIRTSNLRPSVAIYGEPKVFSQGKNRLCCVQHQPAAVSSRIKNSSCLSGHNSFDFHNRCQCCYFEIPKSNSRRRSRERVSRMVVQKAMFERFNVEAIKVIMLSQEEGRRLGHNFVGTEQLLLGLIKEDTGIAGKVLKSMGINLKDARVEVEKIIGRGRGFVAVEIPFTPRAKRVLELSLEEAEKLGHNDIGTEHLLLGLLREGEGIAARVFENLGVDPSNIHTQVIKKVSSSDNEVIKKVSSSDNEVIIESSSFSDPKAMFRHFTEEAIIVIMLAQEEARCLGHNFVGTEQILLGLIGEGTCIAGKVLKSMGINLTDARVEVEKIIGRGSGFVPVEIPFTPRAQRVLDLSLEEAKKLGLNYYVSPEHLLLGLIREGDGVAARVLANLGVDPSNIRAQVIKKVSSSDNEVIDSSSFSDPLNQVSTDKQRKFHRGSLRSCTKVKKHGTALGRSVDLAKFNGYDELISELDQLFEFNGELKARNKNWLIVYTDDEGDLMLVGDDPWQEFGNMVRKIYIYTRDEVQRMNPKKGA